VGTNRRSWFDKLTTNGEFWRTSVRPERFDSPFVLSLSKDERLAQDRLVEKRIARLAECRYQLPDPPGIIHVQQPPDLALGWSAS
jgi:hypothetical protein